MSATDKDWIRDGAKRVNWATRSFLDALFGPIECDDCGLWMSRNAMRWELEDGRTVCHRCCVADTSKLCREVREIMDIYDSAR